MWLRTFRNKTLANPKFVALAERLPFMRPIARKRAKSLFDLVAGLAYSQTLFACVELGLIEKVGLEGSTIDRLATATGWTTAQTNRLVGAATSLHLFEREGDQVFLGQQGAALLAQPWIMRFIAHHKHFAEDLLDPVALLSGKLPNSAMKRYWDYDNNGADRAEYSALMAASQEAVSRQILGGYSFKNHKQVLDIGGGTGAFLRALGGTYPHLKRTLADLPPVVELARADPRNAGMEFWGGDARSEPLPEGADVMTFVRVLHDHDDGAVHGLFDVARRKICKGGVVLVAEPFAGDPATASVTDAYFNLYFAAMGQGRTRTPEEIAAIAKQHGFGRWRQFSTHMPIISGVMVLYAD